MIDPSLVSFYRSWLAFPNLRSDRTDDIVVSVYPNGRDQGGNYGFTIEGVGTEPGPRGLIALQVQLFQDSWRAFRDLPDFFALLARLDTSAREMPRPGVPDPEPLTAEQLRPMLSALGWRDVTDRHARGHGHVLGCILCHARAAGEVTSWADPLA